MNFFINLQKILFLTTFMIWTVNYFSKQFKRFPKGILTTLMERLQDKKPSLHRYINIHVYITYVWLCVAALMPVILIGIELPEDSWFRLATVTVCQSVMILTIPLLLNVPLLRRWFCWTDALSEKQKTAWGKRKIKKLIRIGRQQRCSNKLLPYVQSWLILSALLFCGHQFIILVFGGISVFLIGQVVPYVLISTLILIVLFLIMSTRPANSLQNRS